MVGSQAKWLPVAHATLVLFTSPRQSWGAGLWSPQNVPETACLLHFLLLVSFANGDRRPSPESYDCPHVSSWASQLLCARGGPSGTVGLKWPQPSGHGEVMATKKLAAAAAAERCPRTSLLSVRPRQIILFPSLEMPKACPCQSH